VSAAVRVAAVVGYVTDDPSVVQESNNFVVWLRPHPIIAKVGRLDDSEEALLREHAVATWLAAHGATIAPPVTGIEPTRDERTGFLVTLWQRFEHQNEREPEETDVGRSLRELHDDLANYEGKLPSFQVGLRRARTALDVDGLMAALPRDDRSMLRRAIDQLSSELDTHDYVERPLHGEPHGANLLVTSEGLRWIDLEDVCIGPLEWDLAFLPDDALGVFRRVDNELLGLLRVLNDARVATWCWVRADLEDMRRQGEFHLEQVRRATRRIPLADGGAAG
jgi:Ser/Thr protein kinase RdoA (MazF antagonist)